MVILFGGCAKTAYDCQTRTDSKVQKAQRLKRLLHDAMQRYSSRPGYKAFAATIDDDGKWKYYFTYGYKSQRKAIEAALQKCDDYPVDTKTECELYAVGDRIIGEKR